MWKKKKILALALGLASAAIMATAADPQGPAAVDLGKYADKKPKSVFDHKKHVDEIKVDCKTCHHTVQSIENIKTCSADGCHGSKTEDNKPGLTGMRNAFHKSCLDCHKKEKAAGKNAPTKCIVCHVAS